MSNVVSIRFILSKDIIYHSNGNNSTLTIYIEGSEAKHGLDD
uniref:Uncharacterized protein n=1 Tax=Lepeophtheirus salmonis TaxID=72036 RepID=A0A0K2VD68_LEPSM